MDRTARFRKATKGGKPQKQFVYGIFLGAETVDPDLSQVQIAGGNIDGSALTLRFVPRGKHVTGLVVGATVLLAGNPRCIIAEVVGDIALAEV